MAHDLAQNHPPSPEALAQGYEPAEIRVRGLFIFLICFAISIVLIWVIVWYVEKAFLANERQADQPRSAIADQQPPPPPRIQPSMPHDQLPYQDLEDMRSNEDSVFAKLGWQVDSKTHAVIMPDSILQRVEQSEAARKSASTLPTATPRGANTILPGPPTTQNTHETGGSPQGPTPNERPDLSDKNTTAGSGGAGHGPRPERSQP
jgi:hypothetical protein